MTQHLKDTGVEITKESALKLMMKYPTRIPVVIEKVDPSLGLTKFKYLCPRDVTLAQFLYSVRAKMHVTGEKAVFVSVGGVMPPSSWGMGKVYDNYQKDEFLSLVVSGENTFGCVFKDFKDFKDFKKYKTSR